MSTAPQHYSVSILVDPQQLVHDNPSTREINRPSYRDMERRFNPARYQPITVVWVRFRLENSRTIRRQMIVDGHTRALLAANHPDLPIPSDYGWTMRHIPAIDVTPDELVRLGCSSERDALTAAEYGTLLIPPTVTHAEIAAARVARHLGMMWDAEVGPAIAAHMPASAAIHLLAGAYAAADSGGRMPAHVAYFEDETPRDHQDIDRALKMLRAFMDDAGVLINDVLREALCQLADDDATPDRAKATARDVYGLLRSTAAGKKIVQAAPTLGEQEKLRADITRAFLNGVRSRRSQVDAATAYTALIRDVLNDEALAIRDLLAILRNPQPDAAYKAFCDAMTTRRITEAYQKECGRDRLTETERTLLAHYQMRGYASAATPRQQAEHYRGIGLAARVADEARAFVGAHEADARSDAHLERLLKAVTQAHGRLLPAKLPGSYSLLGASEGVEAALANATRYVATRARTDAAREECRRHLADYIALEDDDDRRPALKQWVDDERVIAYITGARGLRAQTEAVNRHDVTTLFERLMALSERRRNDLLDDDRLILAAVETQERARQQGTPTRQDDNGHSTPAVSESKAPPSLKVVPLPRLGSGHPSQAALDTQRRERAEDGRIVEAATTLNALLRATTRRGDDFGPTTLNILRATHSLTGGLIAPPARIAQAQKEAGQHQRNVIADALDS